MRHKYLDLLLVLGIAVANVVWALLATSTDLTPFSVVNIILAVPLVLVAPGYALSALFFPQRSMEAVQRLAFTIALSVALTILSGFLLNQLPTGLRPLPWALLLGVITTIFALLASLRRIRQPAAVPQPGARPQRGRVQISTILLIGMAMLVLVLSVTYSVVGAEGQSHPGFTNLWIVPATEAGNTCAVSIGMQSFELAPATYRVVITTNKVQTASWPLVALSPTQAWAELEPIPLGKITSLYVLVQVYRLDQPQAVYRHVDLTLHVAVNKGTTVKQCSISSVFPSSRNIASTYSGRSIL